MGIYFLGVNITPSRSPNESRYHFIASIRPKTEKATRIFERGLYFGAGNDRILSCFAEAPSEAEGEAEGPPNTFGVQCSRPGEAFGCLSAPSL
jgi:hypothetical protein